MTHVTHDHADAPGHLDNSQARWGAIFAGIAVALALLCFFQLLGLAIGVSIIDLSNAEAIGAGFGIGVLIWTALSWCAALFLGAMLTARLSGETNEAVGLLNGVTLWASTSLLVMVLAYTSIASLVGGTVSLASSVVSGSASAVASTGRAFGSAASSLSEGDSMVADEVIAYLKEQASESLASPDEAQGPSATDLRRSVDQLDAETVRAFAGHIVEGDIDDATEQLAGSIALPERDLRRVVERVSTQVKQILATAGADQPLGDDAVNRIRSAIASSLGDLARPGRSDVRTSEIRAALDDLDMQAMQTIAWRLIQGDADGARNALIANTSLSRDEATDLISGIETNLKRTITRYREQAEEFADAVGDYAQGVLWGAFFVSTLSLGATALGGYLGALPVTRRVVRTGVTRVAR